jgi:hypothetical protein
MTQLYTAYVETVKPVTTGSGKNQKTEERRILTVYYDISLDQVHAYRKKFSAIDVMVEPQSKKLGKPIETTILDDIAYTKEAIENTKAAAERPRDLSGIPAGGFKKVDHVAQTPVERPRSTEAALGGGDYASLVNKMVQAEADPA